jgi:methylenetetrahydrofolate reductase (NADPH)
MPEALVDEVLDSPKQAKEIGKRWARAQATELIEHGVPCVHFYVMSDASPVIELVRELS